MDADRQTGMSKWTLTGTTRDGQRLEVRGCDFTCWGRPGNAKGHLREDRRWRLAACDRDRVIAVSHLRRLVAKRSSMNILTRHIAPQSGASTGLRARAASV